MSIVAIEAPQQMQALAKANDVRRRNSRVKKDIAAGRMTFAEALEHPDAGAVTVIDLLCAQHLWGKTKARRALRSARKLRDVPVILTEDRRVDALTPRERDVLVEAVEGRQRAD